MTHLNDSAYSQAFVVVADYTRKFFRYHNFSSVGELLTDACTNGPSEQYVQYVLSSRVRSQNRRTLADIRHQLLSGEQDPWFTAFSASLWTMYVTHRSLSFQQRITEDSALRSMSRSQRELLSGSRQVRRRRPDQSLVKQRHLEAFDSTVTGSVLQWGDNFAKFKFPTNPQQPRDMSISVTVTARIALPMKLTIEMPWPSVQHLFDSVAATAGHLHRLSGTLGDEVRTLLAMDLSYAEIRVPCDLRRQQVVSAPWLPCHILSCNVGSNSGLVEMLDHFVSEQQRYGGTMPLLFDVNIFYRVCRAIYTSTNVSFSMRAALRHIPCVFGLWHPYVHCLKSAFKHFFPLWAALEDSAFIQPTPPPANVRVYCHPKVVRLEHMVAGLFLCRTPLVLQKLQSLCAHTASLRRHGGALWDEVAKALRLLVAEYVPTLFFLGHRVRSMYWTQRAPGTGDLGYQFLAHCLHFLTVLEGSRTTEYLRGLSLALLLWHPDIHDRIPAAYMVEECLEASLSRLQSAAQTELSEHTAAAFSILYGSLGPVPSEPHDVNSPGLSEVFPYRLEVRLEKMMLLIRQQSLRFLHPPAATAKFAQSLPHWPPSFVAPRRLLVPTLSPSDFHKHLAHSLRLLMSVKGGADMQSFRWLCRFTTPPSTATVTTLQQLYATLSAQLAHHRNLPRRRGRDRRAESPTSSTASSTPDEASSVSEAEALLSTLSRGTSPVSQPSTPSIPSLPSATVSSDEEPSEAFTESEDDSRDDDDDVGFDDSALTVSPACSSGTSQ